MKNCAFAIASLTLAIFAGENTASAATYYVSRTGSDAYSCAQAQSNSTPKQTLNNAVACLAPGDTLLVRGGIYAESLGIGVVPSGTSWTTKVGIRAYPGEVVWMQPTDPSRRVLDFSRSQHYIEFDSIHLDGSRSLETIKVNAGSPNEDAHHIRVQNAEVIGPTHSGTGGPTGMTVIMTAASSTAQGGNEFINLRVHGGMANDFDQSFYVQSPGNLIEGCEIFDFPGTGIQIYNGYGVNPSNNIIRKNVIHDGRSTVSGQRHTGITVTGSGNQVYNNIVFNIPSNGANPTVGIYVYGASGTVVYNNTVYHNANEGLVVESGSSSSIVRNNISYNNGGGNFRDSGSGTTQSNNLFGSDPKFVNAASNDFRLQSGSPAINNGASVSVVTTDIIGVPRPQGGSYDIGAYEAGGALAAPTGLRILGS